MRENKQFGKRCNNKKKLPDDKRLKEIFGIVIDSIRKMTSHNITKGDNKNEIRKNRGV